jgi:hypothetical protein
LVRNSKLVRQLGTCGASGIQASTGRLEGGRIGHRFGDAHDVARNGCKVNLSSAGPGNRLRFFLFVSLPGAACIAGANMKWNLSPGGRPGKTLAVSAKCKQDIHHRCTKTNCTCDCHTLKKSPQSSFVLDSISHSKAS